MELFKVVTEEEAVEKLNEQFNTYELGLEMVNILDASDRILAEDIVSKENVPDFNRSTVDGYAVVAKDTYGASDNLPAFFDQVGTVEMGIDNDLAIESGQCVYVPTGGMLPKGADAMVMIEYSEAFDETSIAINKPLANGENIMAIGNDVKINEKILLKYKTIKFQDIGVLASLGIEQVKVLKKPTVTVISTGDEIIDISEPLSNGKIRDINAYTLSTMMNNYGCDIIEKRIVKDNYDDLKLEISKALKQSDFIIISGGSSVGTKDYTPEVINELGNPGVFVHGVAIKPGKPTILANVNGKAVFGLPGQPISAIIACKLFVERYINVITKQGNVFSPYIIAEATNNVHSAMGRVHYQMVTLKKEDCKFKVTPVYGKSGMISLMSRADGYICIPKNKEGIEKGDKVKVYLL